MDNSDKYGLYILIIVAIVAVFSIVILNYESNTYLADYPNSDQAGQAIKAVTTAAGFQGIAAQSQITVSGVSYKISAESDIMQSVLVPSDNKFIVRFKSNKVSVSKSNSVGIASASAGITSLNQEDNVVSYVPVFPSYKDKALGDKLGLSDFYYVTVSGKNSKDAVADFKNNPDVIDAKQYSSPVLATVGSAYGAYGVSFPVNDNLFAYQWYLSNTGQDFSRFVGNGILDRPGGVIGKPGADVKAIDAWKIYNSGTAPTPIIIADLDDGVDIDHPDLSGHIFLTGNDNTFTGTVVGGSHGTMTSGMAAAVTNNDVGIASLCEACKINPRHISPYDIVFAADNGARVATMSFSGGSSDYDVASAYAHAKNMVLVAATGNNFDDSISYPAASDYVIGVAASNMLDQPAYFTTYGSAADVAAPGVAMLGLNAQSPDIMYTWSQGTSASAPLVASLAGMLISKDPTLTSDEVYTIIKSSADQVFAPNDNYVGIGRINAYKAISMLPMHAVAKIYKKQFYDDAIGTYDFTNLDFTSDGRLSIRGSAFGNNFDHYTLEYSESGENYPTSYTLLSSSSTQVQENILGYYKITKNAVAIGKLKIRLKVYLKDGKILTDERVIKLTSGCNLLGLTQYSNSLMHPMQTLSSYTSLVTIPTLWYAKDPTTIEIDFNGAATSQISYPSIPTITAYGVITSPPFKAVFATDSSTNFNGVINIQCTDVFGTSKNFAFNLKKDVNPPHGGSINYPNGNYYQPFVNVNYDIGKDDGSGMQSAYIDVLYSNDLDTCENYIAYSVGIENISNATVGAVSVYGNRGCYKFLLSVDDIAGNQVVYTNPNIVKVMPGCSDGTAQGIPYSSCSTTKPYYCNNGNLVSKCQTCGCKSETCTSSGSCTTSGRSTT